MLVDHDFAELFSDIGGAGASTPGRTNPRATTLVAVKVRSEGLELNAACLDLSSGGVFLRTSQLVAVGTAVTLEIDLPTGHASVSGVVRWAHVDAEGIEGLGVQLQDVSDEALESIAAYRSARGAGRGEIPSDRFTA